MLPVPGNFAVLCELITYTAENSAFYARKWADIGCSAVPSSPEDFATRFPFTTKAELAADQSAHPPYGTALNRPVSEYLRCHHTSGSTGSPIRWLDTASDWSALTDDWVTVFQAAGVTRSDRVFVAFSFGPFLGFWLAFEAAQRLGCLTLPGGGMSSSLRARALLDNRCTILCGTPTYLLHLAAAAQEAEIDLTASGVRLLLVAGEPGGSLPAVRQRISQAWPGARVFDHHGMTETGPVSYEHPEIPGSLVVLGRSFWAEIIEPGGRNPVPDGAIGELVLTTLRRRQSPVFRYRTGDLVRAVRTNSQGTLEVDPTALILEGGILARTDDMVIVRGVNIFPTAVDEIVRGFPEIGEYRVLEDRTSELVEISLQVEAPEGVAEKLSSKLSQRLGIRIPVARVDPGSLPRYELKARRWVRRNGQNDSDDRKNKG